MSTEATLTVPQGPDDVQTPADVTADYHDDAPHRPLRVDPDRRRGSRHAFTGPDGTHYPAGHGRSAARGLQHARQPVLLDRATRETDAFAASLRPAFISSSSTRRATTSKRNRLAMDGVLPDGTKLPFEPSSRGQGFNAVLQTTHRQNFLVPPRAPSLVPARRATCMTDGSALTRSSTSPSRP